VEDLRWYEVIWEIWEGEGGDLFMIKKGIFPLNPFKFIKIKGFSRMDWY